ncbi:hypothetical protein J1614_009773 [Plenodomus biglobosus]|nr:hypothetical protein J1614_009773 [Plenodomus biglobosus]
MESPPRTSPVSNYVTPPPIPQAIQAIEIARQQSLSLYIAPQLNPTYQTWYVDAPQHLRVRARTQDLYNDRTQTNRQHISLLDAKAALWARIAAEPVVPDAVGSETDEMRLLEVYERVLALYDGQLGYIQDAGQCRLDVWSRVLVPHSRQVREACLSTLEWMEHDYMLRKVDFAREVYAALYQGDRERAMGVLADLAAAYPELALKTENGVTTLRF